VRSFLPEHPRIAIIDDDPRFVAALRSHVEQALPQAEVRDAGNREEIGELLTSFRPELLFLDVIMPSVDGFDVCARVHEDPALAGTAVVVVSGVLTPAARHRFKQLGAKLCVSKPLQPAVVDAVLREYLPWSGREA
jgi:CheY-like chemotaxis protein